MFGDRASWLTDVSEIRLEYHSTGSIRHVAANHFERRWECQNVRRTATQARPLDTGTYCEAKDGQIPEDDFAKLAHFIERSGYYALQPEYDRGVTHAAFDERYA